MKRFLTIAVSALIMAWDSNALAAPAFLSCTDEGENYTISFFPSSRRLTITKEEGYFDPQTVVRRYHVKGVARFDSGYRITASAGEAGPHIIVFTGTQKRVEYTESSFGWVFAVDECH
jgi:hypothetical protein